MAAFYDIRNVLTDADTLDGALLLGGGRGIIWDQAPSVYSLLYLAYP